TLAVRGQGRVGVAVELAGQALEKDRRRSEGDLHECRGARRGQRREQAVDRRLALMLEVVECLRPFDEARALLQEQHRRDVEDAVDRSQASVRVARTQRGLDETLAAARTAHRKPGPAAPRTAGVMNLERDRGLAAKEAPPP